MSSELSYGDNSSSGSSSDGSSSESWTHSPSDREQMVGQSPNRGGADLVPGPSSEGSQGRLRDDAADETDANVEIVEEGEEGETAGLMPATIRGQPDLTPITYRNGHPRVMKEELDGHVGHGLIKSLMHNLCRALGREEVPLPEPYEAIIFHDFFEAGLRFPCEDFVGKVLQCFNLHIHHLTPNAFTWLGVFVMAMKMSGAN